MNKSCQSFSDEELRSQPLVEDDDEYSDLKASCWRFVFLPFAALIILGNYYGSSNPYAVQAELLEKYEINNTQYNLLNSIYSIPNIVLCFFAGVFIDKIGIRVATFSFTLLVLIGHTLFTLSAYQYSYPLALVGRALFGIGSEC